MIEGLTGDEGVPPGFEMEETIKNGRTAVATWRRLAESVDDLVGDLAIAVSDS